MKMISKLLVLATALCLFSTGMAIGATFEIDFHGGDSGLSQGQYDTGTDLSLNAGQTVSVDVRVSGFDQDAYLTAWGLNFDYGSDLQLSNLEVNSELWEELRSPLDEGGTLQLEYGLSLNVEDPGDDILLFSFDLTVDNDLLASYLKLEDLDTRNNTTTNLYQVLDGDLPVDLASINADNPVPVPAAVWLLGSGLTSLLAIRRRKS